MAVIKSGNSTDQLTIDSTSKAARVTLYDAAGNVLTSLPISASSLPLPTGAATETTLAAVNTKLPSQVSGRIPVDGSGVTQPISASALPLPSGAATSANQTTGNASLSSIDTKTPALGQALAAASVPVVLTAAQLSTLTPVSTVTANAGTNLNTSLLALDSTVAKDSSLGTLNTSVNTLLKPASTLAAVTSITNTVVIKADTAGNQTNALKVDGSAVTQPISASALPLPSGAATAANQTTLQTAIDSINTKTPTLVSGRQPVDGSGVTQPVSGTVTSLDEDRQVLLGTYYYSSSAFTVQAAADAATVGRMWIINPVASGVTLRIKSINFSSQLGTALAATSSPRITVERTTFTGTASGTTIAPAKRKTADATNIGSVRTASTGLTLSAGNAVRSFLPVASATAVGYTPASTDTFKPDVNDRIELAPGEGLIFRQADAGTTADTRRYTFDLTVEEF